MTVSGQKNEGETASDHGSSLIRSANVVKQAIKETIVFTFKDEDQQRRFHARLNGEMAVGREADLGEHTPAPWAVNYDGWKVESRDNHGWANDGWIICKCDGPDARANAMLIVAAVNAFLHREAIAEGSVSRRVDPNNSEPSP